MRITDHFSTAAGDKTQRSNKDLAMQIITENDEQAVTEILILLDTMPVKLLADALKVLETIAEIKSELIPDIWDKIFPLLRHADNKICWRAMCVLSPLFLRYQHQVFENLSLILKIMEIGSVITRDHGVKLLIGAYQNASYAESLAPIIAEQILQSHDNQVGQYAEKWMAVILPEHVHLLVRVLKLRQEDLTSDSHQNRIARVLSKLQKKK